MSGMLFKKGDLVLHPKRPEWGNGKVEGVAVVLHQGEKAQRVRVRFSQKGLVTINTGVASLLFQDDTGLDRKNEMSSVVDGGCVGRGWLKNLEDAVSGSSHELWALPESLKDPFLSLEARLRNTAESFKYSAEPRSLIDWSVMQTRLDDPLSKYTRHELEQGLAHFQRDRDLHLKALVGQLKAKQQTQVVLSIMANTEYPKAKVAIAKAMKG